MNKPRHRVKARSVAMLRLVEKKSVPDQDMIEAAADFAEVAGSGEVTAIAMIACYADGSEPYMRAVGCFGPGVTGALGDLQYLIRKSRFE